MNRPATHTDTHPKERASGLVKRRDKPDSAAGDSAHQVEIAQGRPPSLSSAALSVNHELMTVLVLLGSVADAAGAEPDEDGMHNAESRVRRLVAIADRKVRGCLRQIEPFV